MNDILTVNGLNKSYDDFSLKDVTFSLPEGCITGFIGVNGAGKTTTLRTLLGRRTSYPAKFSFSVLTWIRMKEKSKTVLV